MNNALRKLTGLVLCGLLAFFWLSAPLAAHAGAAEKASAGSLVVAAAAEHDCDGATSSSCDRLCKSGSCYGFALSGIGAAEPTWNGAGETLSREILGVVTREPDTLLRPPRFLG